MMTTKTAPGKKVVEKKVGKGVLPWMNNMAKKMESKKGKKSNKCKC